MRLEQAGLSVAALTSQPGEALPAHDAVTLAQGSAMFQVDVGSAYLSSLDLS